MIQGYQLDQSLPLRLFRNVFDNVLLKHGGSFFWCRASGGHSKSLKRFGMTQGYLSLRLCVFYYVLLEHDGLPHGLPLVVHLE